MGHPFPVVTDESEQPEPQAEAPAEPAEPQTQPEPEAQPEPEPQPDPAPEPQAEPQPEAPTAEDERPAVGPKILGVAEEKTVPIVKKRLQEKPKREPLPWPELRAAVAAVRDDLDPTQLKDLFRLFPPKVREEVTDNVREFRKGARRPVSQLAAKQLARASHTARRLKRNAAPSAEVCEALGQAMAAELIASLEPDRAAEVILPKRDLLERESRTARRRAKEEEDKRRDEQRRRRREDARSSRQQTSFGEFSGTKIKGLDELAALLGPAEPEPEPAPAEPEVSPAEADGPAEPASAPDATEPSGQE